METFGKSALLFALMLPGDKDIEGRDDEQRENSTEGHSGDDGDTDGISRRSACAGNERQREVAAYGGDTGHQDWPQTDESGFAHGLEFREAATLERIGKFDDQNAVFGNQADERHQTDLRIDVHRGRPALREERDIRVRHFEKAEDQRAEHRQRDRSEEHTSE